MLNGRFRAQKAKIPRRSQKRPVSHKGYPWVGRNGRIPIEFARFAHWSTSLIRGSDSGRRETFSSRGGGTPWSTSLIRGSDSGRRAFRWIPFGFPLDSQRNPKGIQRNPKGSIEIQRNSSRFGGHMEMYAQNGVPPEDFQGFPKVFEKSCVGPSCLSKYIHSYLL